MKLKKLLIVPMLVFVVALTLVAMTSCGESHEHSFSEWETVSEPTCTAFGLKERACECGKVEYDTLSAIAHTPVTDEAIPSTCTAVGKTEGRHCSVCGTVIVAQTDVAKISHSFSEWETVSAPTCTAFGLKSRACECGHLEYATITAVAHTPVTDEAVPSTCTAVGKTEGSHCSVCGTVIVAQTDVAKISHSFSEWETVSAPTCTAFGLKERACECGQVEYVTVAAVEHTPVTDIAVPSTCTAAGKTEGSHCGVCGTVIVAQTEVAKLDHSFSEWETVSAPTCTAFGLKERACECGQVEYVTVAAVEHTPVTDAAVGVTCTTAGKTEGSHCSVCGVVLVAQSTILPNGHNCSDIAILDEAFCNHDGVKRYSCSNPDCSYYYDESYSLEELDANDIHAIATQYTGVIQAFDFRGHLIREMSAFVISSDGKIVTSHYSLDCASSAVFILNGEYYDVTEVLAYSDSSFIAVLKIDATDLPYADLCMRDPVTGETVYTVGAPDGRPGSISQGIISTAHLEAYGGTYIQHDADMTSGYCGGPLINRYGEVIGVNIAYRSEENLPWSAKVAEIEALDYSNPISIEEYGKITYTPTKQLNDWVFNNSTTSANNTIAYVIYGNGFYYAVGYDMNGGYSFIEGFRAFDGGYELYVDIIFDNYSGTYTYYATMKNEMFTNEVSGYIDAATYDETTVLTYDTLEGRYWPEADLMSLYTSAVYDTLAWFSHHLETYFVDITLETFGFTAVSFDRDDEALAKLNGFIVENGTFVEEKGAYELYMSSAVGEADVAYLTLIYTPLATDVVGSTVAIIEYYYAQGFVYRVSLTLDTTEDIGNLFELEYAEFDGVEFVTKNTAWGYLDPAYFTDISELFCYDFVGLNEYEDVLLLDYAGNLGHLLGWLDYIMTNVSPELSVKDLGFYIYFR